MKTTVIAFIFSAIFSISISAQPIDYSPNQLLILFEPGTSQSHIDEYLDMYNAEELWVSPLTETRLWEIQSFEDIVIEIDGETFIVENIIDAYTGVQGQRGSDASLGGSGLNIKSQVEYIEHGAITTVGLPCPSRFDYYHVQGDASVKIALVDSGVNLEVDEHDAFPFNPTISKVTEYLDKENEGVDQNNHGTHLLSVMNYVADHELEGSESKVSFDIRRVLDEDNSGSLADLILASEESVVAGAQIINMSLGFSDIYGNKFFIENLLDELEDQNVLVVASAGNDGWDLNVNELILPASLQYGNLVTVGSVRCNRRVSAFSNFGTEAVDLGMIGQRIIGYGKEGELIYLSGTSQAAAIVSAISGILATHQADFDAYEIKCALVEGGDHFNFLSSKFTSSGIADASQAQNKIAEGCDTVYGPPIGDTKQEKSIDQTVFGEPIGNVSKERGAKNLNGIYPNPTTGLINIELQRGESTILLSDLHGKVLFSAKESREDDKTLYQLNIESIGDLGLYTISVIDEAGHARNYKVIKK